MEVIRNPSAFARHQEALQASEVEIKVCLQTKLTICDLLEAARTYSDLIFRLMSFCLILLFFSRSLLKN